MELDDCAYPLLRGVVITTKCVHRFFREFLHWWPLATHSSSSSHNCCSLQEACKDVDVCIAVGGMPRKQGMERKDLIAANAPIFVPLGKALNEHASKDVRVLVVANPANTNALLLSQSAPRIPKAHITAMTRLDHNRALAQIAMKAGCHVDDVKNVIIWGNHSSTQYPDTNHCTIGGKPAREVIGDAKYLEGEFVATVQQRGAKVIEARKASSAFSAANAACDHVRDWVVGTRAGKTLPSGRPDAAGASPLTGILLLCGWQGSTCRWRCCPRAPTASRRASASPSRSSARAGSGRSCRGSTLMPSRARCWMRPGPSSRRRGRRQTRSWRPPSEVEASIAIHTAM